MRLIYAEPIEKFIEDGLNNPDKLKAFGHDAIEILSEIHFAPTIDPVSLRAKGEWISVEDRLPEEHVTVLALCKNGAMFTGYCFCDYCDDMRWKIHTALSSTKLLNKGRVSHWMPLPKPPNTEVAHDS